MNLIFKEAPKSNLVELLRARAAAEGDRLGYAFLAEGEIVARLTYADLDLRARAIAALLQEAGAAGERVALLFPPGLDFIAAFFGCLYAGAVAVPALPPRPKGDDPRLRALLRDAQPRVVLTAGGGLQALERAAIETPELRAALWLTPEGGDAAAWRERAPAAGDLAFLQYTSGSTATPKGVMVSYGNLLDNEERISETFEQSADSVVLGWLPLYHDMGLIGNVLNPIHTGAPCYLMPPTAFLQRPASWLEAIGRFRATTSGGPNFAYELCLRKIPAEERAALDLSSWRVAFNGAEPVRASTLRRFAEAFAPAGFRAAALRPCYGLAEATLLVSGRRQDEPRGCALDATALEEGRVTEAAEGARRRELVGCGLPMQSVRIVDPELGIPCPEDRVGEVWVAGPSVARGYWRNPEETAATFEARLADGEGPFLRTGDLGFLRDGELFLAGRSKDLIILRGRNHYPQDLELTAERSHGDLRPGGGAAFALDAGEEERLVLVHEVARRSGGPSDVAEIADAIRRAVAREHGVSVWEVVLLKPEALPKTSSGKVRRSACRAAYRTGGLAELGRSPLGAEADAVGSAGGDRAAVLAGEELAGRGLADRRGPLETLLRDRLAAVLHLSPSQVPAATPLGALGLDSLSAAELKGELEKALGTSLPFGDLLGGAGVAELAAQLAAATGGGALGDGVGMAPPPLAGRAEPDDGEAPLSLGQRALWYLHRLAPESAAYNLALAARLVGEVDSEALRAALAVLLDRHDSFRSTFHPGAEGPIRRIAPEIGEAWGPENAAGWSSAELRRRIDEAAFRPFDLERGSFRAALFTRSGESFLVLAAHHAVADFASLTVVARELGTLYHPGVAGGGDLPLAPLELRFSDFARWQEEAVASPWGERLWAYWRERLAGAPALLLPTDRPRPSTPSFRGTARRARLGTNAARDLAGLAREGGATPFVALLAVYGGLLARISGQTDFVVGSPTSGRLMDRFGDRLAGLVGYFVNPVPLRADLADDPSTVELLARLRTTALDGFEHQDFPFARLAERLRPERDAGLSPVFQVLLTLQKAPAPELQALSAFALGEPGARLSLGGLQLESIALDPTGAPLDLNLMAAELDGDLAVSLGWSSDLFDVATGERLLGHFGRLLKAMAAAPGRPVSELPLLSDAERDQLAAWNATQVPWDLGRTLGARIAEQAGRTPEAVAVEGEGENDIWTYADLLGRARRVAGALRARGVGPDSLVGIAAERSPEMVAGLIGILLAGAAYVPLDPEYPRERLSFMLADSKVRVLLTQRHLLPSLPETPATLLCLEEPEFRSAAAPDEDDEVVPGDADGLAYMIYTSGSTGRPKGVMNTHRGIVNRLLWMQETFALTPADRVLQKTPIGFDVSVWELFWPLLTGARLVLARPGGHQDPAYLARRIADSGVTTLHFVPSLLQAFLDEPGAGACRTVRRVIASGEALSGALARRFAERLGATGAKLHNLYGPTEAAVDVTWWPVGGEDGVRPVPIGLPIANTRIHLLDAHGAEVPVGVAGELSIGGVQLARGYWRRPDLTAERFVPDPLSGKPGARLYRTGDLARRLGSVGSGDSAGAVDFLGRIDYQVKLRGVRIELGEVESALTALPEIRAAVAGIRGTEAEARLAAWVVAAPGEAPDFHLLRESLRRRLPEAMIPSLFALLPALPLTPNGKVDRKVLPDPEGLGKIGRAPYVAPRTPVEETLVGIWQELLEVAPIGVDDHFFDLGGHSLLATRLMARVREAFAINVPLAALFEDVPTVAGLAGAIARFQVHQADEDDLASALLELEGLSEDEIRALLASEEA